jgi:hypothetical protein
MKFLILIGLVSTAITPGNYTIQHEEIETERIVIPMNTTELFLRLNRNVEYPLDHITWEVKKYGKGFSIYNKARKLYIYKRGKSDEATLSKDPAELILSPSIKNYYTISYNGGIPLFLQADLLSTPNVYYISSERIVPHSNWTFIPSN